MIKAIAGPLQTALDGINDTLQQPSAAALPYKADASDLTVKQMPAHAPQTIVPQRKITDTVTTVPKGLSGAVDAAGNPVLRPLTVNPDGSLNINLNAATRAAIKGIQGDPGANGFFNWRGAYAGGTTYAKGDGVYKVVGAAWCIFMSLTNANTGNDPDTDVQTGTGGVAGVYGTNWVMIGVYSAIVQSVDSATHTVSHFQYGVMDSYHTT